MSDDVEAVVVKVVEKAKNGDMTAARLILDRVVPPRRGRPVPLELPDVSNAGGVVTALASLVKAMAAGKISAEEAASIAAVIETQRRALETEQLEARMAAIEEKLSHEQNN